MDSGRNQVQINDRWIFLIVYPVLALAIVHIGNENSFRELIRIPSYYTDLLLAFGCTWGAGFSFRMIFRWIDRRHDWKSTLRQRLISHLVFGVILPVLVLLGIELAYLSVIRIEILKSSVFYLELPLITLFCLLINLIYLFLYHRSHTVSLTPENTLHTNGVSDTRYKQNFPVHSGGEVLNIPLQKVAYFIVLARHTFLITCEGKQYLYPFTLEQISSQVSPRTFFQLNRQIIAGRQSISRYRLTHTRRLEVDLIPPQDEPVFVSKTKVNPFNTWLNNP